MSMNERPVPPVADLGAVYAYASSAKTLIQTARNLREGGASQSEIDNVLDAAELQIDAMIASLPGRLF